MEAVAEEAMFIVTGAAGFIGSAMLWKLNRLGHRDCLAVDLGGTATQSKNLAHVSFRDYLGWHALERRLEDSADLRNIEGVFHLGACSATTERNWAYLQQVNLDCTRRLAQWCLARDVRFIYASSAATYGAGEQGYDDDPSRLNELKPLNFYGWSKQLLDQWAFASGAATKMVGLKFFNVYGPNEYHKGDMASVVYKAFHQIQKTGRLQLFRSHKPEYADGEQMRDFVYVKDVVDVMWNLHQKRQVNGVFNVGTGTARSWNDLGRAVFAAMDLPAQIDYVDMPPSLRSHYQYYTKASTTNLENAGCRADGWSLEAGVADYVRGHLATPCPYLSPYREAAPAAATASPALASRRKAA